MSKLKNYEKTENTNQIQYKHSQRTTKNYTPTINLSIVETKDEKLRLKIEPNDYFSNRDRFTLHWSAQAGGEIGDLFYCRKDAVTDYLFAAELINFINLDFEITFCGIEVFNREQAQIFIDVFKDYHNLIANGITKKP